MDNSARERIFPFTIKKEEDLLASRQGGLAGRQGKVALVVGGAGFLGSYICEQLLSQGFSVICVDNLTSGDKENIGHLLSSPNFSFVKDNINSPGFSLPERIKIDVVFHAAGLEEYSADEELSLETLLVNSLGTRVLLELAKSENAKFIFISSAHLYSGVFSSTSLQYYFGRDPASESLFTHNEAKRFAEALVFEYYKNYGLFAQIVRVKDVYGPKMNLQAEGTINGLIKEVVYSSKLTIFGDGLKTLNPTYITDVSTGVVKASLVGGKGEIYNLVNPEKMTVNSLAQMIKQVAGSVEIVHKGESEDLDPPYHQLDLSTSFEKLDWRPKVGLPDGISETINYFRRNKEEIEKKPPQPLFILNQVGPTGQSRKQGMKKTLFPHVRLTIFLASLTLILITVVYPASALVLNTYRANKNFKSAIANLEADRVGASQVKAKVAESSYQRASQNLENLRWLLQIFLDRSRITSLNEFYFAGENLSASTFYTGTALDILINQASQDKKISDEELKKYLLEIGQNAKEATKKHDLAHATLNSLEENKLPSSLKDDLEAAGEGKLLLEQILQELSTSTGT